MNNIDELISKQKFNDQNYRKSSNFKGGLLELATAIFQDYEVRKYYNARNAELIIKSNVPFYDEHKAKYEIDLWVEVKGSPIHSFLIIFECKNWDKKVGRSNISVFRDKINVVNKSHNTPVKGIILAKKFTKDALKACLSKSDNIKPLIVDDTYIPSIFPEAINYELLEKGISLFAIDSKSEKKYDVIKLYTVFS